MNISKEILIDKPIVNMLINQVNCLNYFFSPLFFSASTDGVKYLET